MSRRCAATARMGRLALVSLCPLTLLVTTTWGTPTHPAAAAAPGQSLETLTARVIDIGTPGIGSDASAVAGNVVVGTTNVADGLHPFAYDLGAARPQMRDLGTLGGQFSGATAVDGNIVVGNADLPNGDVHPFAYDLAAAVPTMRDLGTFGGRFGGAAAVDGNLVVGSTFTANGRQRAFAYDLGAAIPAMRPLGTLGGANSGATAVSGSLVAGWAETRSGERHAFAYDLAASDGRMRDLGRVGEFSEAAAVDGARVVGFFGKGQRLEHAFAYDLGSEHPAMQDLDTLAGRFSRAKDVDGTLVVGGATRAGRQFPFTADLAGASPRMRALGTLGGDAGIAVAVDGGIAVGSAELPDHTSHAFAVDLAAAVPHMTDLGTRGRLSVANAIDGDLVAGESGKPDEATHATAWILSKSTAPSIRFGSFNYRVDENAGIATVAVTRAGDPAPAVGVRYSTRHGTARAGKDFSATSGTLSFAPGQTRTSFKVRILNDSIREAQETLLLDLSTPTGSALLGTPRAAGLRIRPSDQQPDAWIGTRPHSSYVGNNIYNTTGARQTKTVSARRTQTRTFFVRIYNDGTSPNIITLRGSPSPRRSTVRFHRGSIDVTAAMRSPQGLRLRIRASDFRQVRVETRIGPRATIGSTKTVSVSGTWTGDSISSDLVRAATHVIH